MLCESLHILDGRLVNYFTSKWVVMHGP